MYRAEGKEGKIPLNLFPLWYSKETQGVEYFLLSTLSEGDNQWKKPK
jgi:hypothetical protein